MATINYKSCIQKGYGQVEPNRLSGQKGGQLLAQLPVAASIKQIENGQFAKYDETAGEINFTGEGDWYLVFSEVKVYKDFETDKDFVLTKENSQGGLIYPRLVPVHKNDAFTTNQVQYSGEVMPEKGDYLVIGAPAAGVGDENVGDKPGCLTLVDSKPNLGFAFRIAKKYTMPDGQLGYKVVRVQ